MKPRPSANLDMLAIVAKGLKGLKERVVFVGGATLELYVASSAPEGRATDDVDCIVEMASRVKYYALEEELRILGFNNRWYADGMANTRAAELRDGQRVEIFSVPYLLASKIEAFQDRGRGDFMGSRDMEDIITALDGCPYLKEELGKAPEAVRDFLTQRFKEFMGNSRFVDSLQGHIEAVQPRTGRADKVLALLRDFAS